ncbi:hypothetical protein PGSY75_1368000 [Plasmodium gaboni]|uniref:Uncharacterized protein n=1 Tax=Plasmodium gaboni TaxID=647221 RepID=A0A151LEP2_9APIC|nr:hypothetical protein PGSY75_1368000 [Plasmodium gaboni]KYN97435.1 hypothetical protein PGSY75_1368000 [Plasmodium gaboni]
MLKKDLFLFFFFFCFFLLQKNILCSYKECSLLTDDIRILSYCKNESKCFIKTFNNSEYSSITCICKKYLNESFFAGPDCSINVPYHYKTMKNNEVKNTSWIEDLFKLNTWKNEENRVGRVCVNPQCS